MNSTIDIIRENSVKNMDAGKGVQQYMLQKHQEEASVKQVSTGYVVDSVPQQAMNPVYGKPEEEKTVVDQLEADTLATARGRKNQMAILSNTTTAEDYKKMQEEGFSLSNTNVRTVVTVQDHIKANIAKTGGEVTGEISDEAIEEIAGNQYLANQIKQAFAENDLPITSENEEGIREAVEMVTQTDALSTQEQLYLVKNEYEPTIANVYKAKHSAGLPMPTRDVSVDEIRSQVEAVIAGAGFEVNAESLEDAQTLIDNKIPLNEKNLSYYKDLKEMAGEMPTDEFIVDQIVDAVQEGNAAISAKMISGYSITDQANEVQSVADAVTDEDLAYCIENNQEISIENLRQAKNHRGEVDASKWSEDIRFISAKRALEETRLVMTSEANLALLKKGISIDTKPLQEVVSELKQLEQNYYETLLSASDIEPSEANVNNYRSTIELLSELKSAPATILTAEEVEETLKGYADKASAQKADYEKAGAEYEKLWTAPRKDMGDSITKAFRNVDDILSDLKLELTSSNRRAVRILAYNQNEITVENIEIIKEKDEEMQRLFKNLTPRTTLELIRRGENPMDMSISKLNEIAEQIKSEIGDEGVERFEKFLYKLEKNKEISEEERSSYIGIYRLIAQVEKNDGAALGAAYNQGSDISMRSLLTQLRNGSKKNSDYTVDDDFDGVVAKGNGPKIDRQIEAAFKNRIHYQNQCVKDVADALTPSNMQVFADESWMNLTPEQLKEQLANQSAEVDSAVEDEYAKEMLEELEMASKASDEIYEHLNRLDVPTTVGNVLAMQQLMANPGAAISTIWNAKDLLKEAKEELTERFAEAVENPEELADALKDLEEVAVHCMDSMVVEAEAKISSVDIKAMQLATKQISIAAKQADVESFLIPLETADGVTGVSLTVVRSSGKKGIVDIFLESAAAGKIAASFEAKREGISGSIICGDRDSREILSQKIPALANALAGETGESVDLGVAYSENVSPIHRKPSDSEVPNDEEYSVQTGRLYRIAKSFIEFASEFI